MVNKPLYTLCVQALTYYTCVLDTIFGDCQGLLAYILLIANVRNTLGIT